MRTIASFLHSSHIHYVRESFSMSFHSRLHLFFSIKRFLQSKQLNVFQNVKFKRHNKPNIFTIHLELWHFPFHILITIRPTNINLNNRNASCLSKSSFAQISIGSQKCFIAMKHSFERSINSIIFFSKFNHERGKYLNDILTFNGNGINNVSVKKIRWQSGFCGYLDPFCQWNCTKKYRKLRNR